MADIWVLTNPTDEDERELIRADAISRVRWDKERVVARWAGQETPVSLVEWSARFDKRDPLPSGFHLEFVRTLNQARQEAKADIQVVRAAWDVGQQKWQWLVEDIDLVDQF
ncbi:hypothetical protein OG883_44585 [Streptomyces sp. NBC_01142]|uniref:hypothetical protein n=1 Tax=Streptomyces sp. NBC_01142 TaxID=2975865 RepID=UPI00224FB4FF|nr:hypothetical protein [Streptomyces sp. NBC_01142]MCX4826723.1 hypothetical protein [Streptomyces sp. NBC_01142]